MVSSAERRMLHERCGPYGMHVRRYLWVLDLLAGLAIAGSGVVQLLLDPSGGSFHGPRWVNVIWLVALGTAVTIRRWRPLLALLLLPAVGIPVQMAYYRHAAQPPFQPFPAILLVVYMVSVTAVGPRRRAALGVVIGATTVTDVAAAIGGRSFGNLLPPWVFVTLAWLVGSAVRRRQAAAEEAHARADLVASQHDAAVEAAAAAERARIARELHDVVTHTVSGMVVQASVEARANPDGETHDVLVSIEEAGREALGELRRLLGVLRHEDEGQVLAPQPGLAQLGSLIGATELPVRFHMAGLEGLRLSPGVDLSAYRVVQEGLTNVRKHARDVTEVTVTLRHADGTLEIEIADDGVAHSSDDAPGFGLIGLRERVALHSGLLRAGPTEPRGYQLWVQLPSSDEAR